jgi:hypothetical protein
MHDPCVSSRFFMKKLKRRDLDGSAQIEIHLVYKLMTSKGGPYIWSRHMKRNLKEHWETMFFSNFPLMLKSLVEKVPLTRQLPREVMPKTMQQALLPWQLPRQGHLFY